ncbi:hypothetical protein [Paractinoplanes rishiriensis]|uniref:Uncharacterized protein n=1 Tax=Paractinoplanes rishiriensis TaxID=1050105 RepID=A0A919JW56_9ACTN|nr:hypothetical protein [Actinoplanes rishiriensis]GIE95938.1 hypothetical protein Ari01nite_34030 [Actinoplanes rishiriensis]
MKLGLLTACLPNRSLEQIAAWASENAFEALEVATRVVDALYEGGFDGVLSVEHEDPLWGGTEDKIETGLRVAHRTLRPLLVA